MMAKRKGGSRRPTQRASATKPTIAPVAAAQPVIDGALPADGASYTQILRGEGYAWWRSLLGALFGLSLFALLTPVVSQALVTVFWAITAADQPYKTYYESAFAFERPGGMLATNLGIAALIPISWVLMATVHHMRPRWLSSVRPRLRWRYLLVCLAIAAVALNGVMLLSTWTREPVTVDPQAGFWAFALVILLTSPIQAAAEEIFFRGYLMQALGSLVAKQWFGVVVSSLVFALLHGTQNLPLFIDRLAFGLLAGLLVLRTGGIEAGIAAHVVNNVFAYGIAGLTGSVAELKALQQISWSDAAFDVGGFALFAALAFVAARKMRLRTQVDLSAAGETRVGNAPASAV